MKLLKGIFAIILVLTVVIACKETKKGAEKDIDEAVEVISDAADDVKEVAKDAADDVADATEEAVKAVEEATDEAAEEVSDAIEEVSDDVKKAAKKTGITVDYPSDPELANGVKLSMATILKDNPSLSKYFAGSAGYAIFPKITKGGLGIGGAGGHGLVFEKGAVVGKSTLMQATIGLQAGGQQYQEVIFFETQEALNHFKNDKFKFSAGASAVMLEDGASIDAPYQDGVAIFTKAIKGVMAEAAIGSQKFKYEGL